MQDTIKIGLLRDEYLLLQKFYEDFDGRIITIKGWSATIGMAAIGGGFYQSRYLWFFGAGAALIFWIIESLWKSFQYMYGPRIQEIEEAFRKDDFGKIVPMQVYSSWFDVLRQEGFGIWRNFCLGIVAFPHAITLAVGATLFALNCAGYFSPLPAK